MTSKTKRHSIADVARFPDEEGILLAYGEFLDGFKNAEKQEKMRLLADKPDFSNIDDSWCLNLSATAHKLANDNDLPAPSWIFDYEPRPSVVIWAYGTENEEFRAYLEKTTPIEFRSRGLMYGENVMKRV